jgi:hypothetical protein
MTTTLTEFKARKAKFGFKRDYVGVTSFIPLGKMLESLYNNFADTDFWAEMVGMCQTDFRLYTDNESVAFFLRENGYS